MLRLVLIFLTTSALCDAAPKGFGFYQSGLRANTDGVEIETQTSSTVKPIVFPAQGHVRIALEVDQEPEQIESGDHSSTTPKAEERPKRQSEDKLAESFWDLMDLNFWGQDVKQASIPDENANADDGSRPKREVETSSLPTTTQGIKQQGEERQADEEPKLIQPQDLASQTSTFAPPNVHPVINSDRQANVDHQSTTPMTTYAPTNAPSFVGGDRQANAGNQPIVPTTTHAAVPPVPVLPTTTHAAPLAPVVTTTTHVPIPQTGKGSDQAALVPTTQGPQPTTQAGSAAAQASASQVEETQAKEGNDAEPEVLEGGEGAKSRKKRSYGGGYGHGHDHDHGHGGEWRSYYYGLSRPWAIPPWYKPKPFRDIFQGRFENEHIVDFDSHEYGHDHGHDYGHGHHDYDKKDDYKKDDYKKDDYKKDDYKKDDYKKDDYGKKDGYGHDHNHGHYKKSSEEYHHHKHRYPIFNPFFDPFYDPFDYYRHNSRVE